jgi:hypothetical protein
MSATATQRIYVGSGRVLETYHCNEGERVLVGERIDGRPCLIDKPADENVDGKVYLIAADLPNKAELDGIVSDYLAEADELGRCPAATSALARRMEAESE